jgi:hypothetical protein
MAKNRDPNNEFTSTSLVYRKEAHDVTATRLVVHI